MIYRPHEELYLKALRRRSQRAAPGLEHHLSVVRLQNVQQPG